MKSLRTIMISGGLAVILAVTAAFISVHNSKTVKDLQAPANGAGFAVVELFTSEGCSSCPPADELMQKIQETNKDKQIYILAFHVDYWDHQGWKDRFSDHAFSERQQQYGAWLHLNTVYTPQVVVNGTYEYIGSNESAVVTAIAEALAQPPVNTLTLNGKVENDQVKVTYESTGDEKDAALVLALVQKSAQSRVKAGENVGRALSHVQIVRSVYTVPLNTAHKKEVAIKLPKNPDNKGFELIGFVQHTSNGHIAAAARLDVK